jgi:arabinogalactan endo-1,4-beta-galactosidase
VEKQGDMMKIRDKLQNISPLIVLLFAAYICALLPFMPCYVSAQTRPYENNYAFGLDISSVKQRQDRGGEFRDEGVVKPPLQIFRDHGYNWGRIRICNEPARLPQNREYVIALAQEAKKAGLKFLLVFMYSNSWADPTNQPMPSDWREMSHEARVKALYEFTRETIKACSDANCLPDMVQIGNEIGNGLLWPDGRLFHDGEHESQWDNVAEYLSAGIKAVKDAVGGDKKVPRIMIHVDHGGDIALTKNFFDKLRDYKIEYDVIGFSFYPWSHGTLLDLRDNLRFTANEYGKEIIVVETGYYWTPSRFFREQPGPFPETPEGQRQWLEAVNEIVLDTPKGLGKGVFWWEPMIRGRGYFDNEGNVLSIIHAFEKYTRPRQRTDGQTRIQ